MGDVGDVITFAFKVFVIGAFLLGGCTAGCGIYAYHKLSNHVHIEVK